MEVFPLVSPEISLAIFSSIFSAVVSSIAAILVYKLQNRDHKRKLEELEHKEICCNYNIFRQKAHGFNRGMNAV